MSDPSANTQILRRGRQYEREYGMDGGAQTLYIGQLLCQDDTGYAVKAASTAAYRFLGVSNEKQVIASTETDGTTKIKVQTKGEAKLTVTSVAVTDVGKPVWITDSGTLQLTPSEVFVGWVTEYVTTNTAWVELAGDYQAPRAYLKFTFPTSAASSTKVSNECYACQRDFKILKATAAALAYPDYATSTMTLTKYDLGTTADKTVVNGVSIDGKTAKQVTDLTLTSTAADLLLTAGDTLRASITLGATEAAASESLGLTVEIEFYGRPNA